MLVTGQLHLKVPRAIYQLLDQHAIITEGAHCFATRQVQLRQKVVDGVNTAHAFATSTGAGLDQQWRPDLAGTFKQPCRILIVAVVARDAGHACCGGDALGLDLRAHAGDHIGARTDPSHRIGGAALDQLEAFRQEPVAGVDCAGAASASRLDDGIGVEVTAGSVGGSDAYSAVGLSNMSCGRVGVGVDGNRTDAEPATGVRNTAGNFTTVGDQDGFKHEGPTSGKLGKDQRLAFLPLTALGKGR